MLCIGIGLLHLGAAAQEPDRALLQLQAARPAANSASNPANGPTATRLAPVHKLEWERRLRSADKLGPPPLRPADQALLAAARAARWDEVLRLLKPGHGATPGAGPPARAHANTTDDAGGHALVLAAAAGQEAVLRELLQHGADLERRGEDGFTALGAAAFHGQRGAVRLLLRAGADPARLGASGQTALHLAGAAGQVGVLAELLCSGVPIDLLNNQRETALDVAGAANQTGAMDLLIQGGADLTMAGRR